MCSNFALPFFQPNWQRTKKVEALRVTLNFNQDERIFDCVHCDHFHHLSNLRFLELNNARLEGNPENHLLSNLVWLDWRGCREKSKLIALNMKNLVILNLCSSPVELNLEDWKRLMLVWGVRACALLHLQMRLHLFS